MKELMNPKPLKSDLPADQDESSSRFTKYLRRLFFFFLTLLLFNASWHRVERIGEPGDVILETVEGDSSITGSVTVEAAESGLVRSWKVAKATMPPYGTMSTPSLYLKKGDKMVLTCKSDGPLTMGFFRVSDGYYACTDINGVKMSTYTIPKTDWYKLKFYNNKFRFTSIYGMLDQLRYN